MYIGEHSGSKISKITITDPNPILTDVLTGLNSPTGLAIYEDELYYSEFASNRISKLNLIDPNATPILIATGVSNPALMTLDGPILYIAEYGANKISKIDLSNLGLNEFSTAEVHLYPNPSNSFISINGLVENTEYTIYTITGANIQNGIVNNNEEIDIQSLASGLYLIQMDHGRVLKFVKR